MGLELPQKKKGRTNKQVEKYVYFGIEQSCSQQLTKVVLCSD